MRRRTLTTEEYEQGVINADVAILSRAITLIESHHPDHELIAQDLLARLLARSGNSIRIGITGVPGAGKSTLIETLGCQLCDQGHRIAVLAIDPTSSISGGSILGDKTRMLRLAHHPNAYIRPSPSGGTLGGVARKTRETMILCEAAGYDVIFVETVGVGQNETTVRSMVDFFLLIMLAGAGDELQGMKKGVIELADLLAVNKADGDNVRNASLACSEYNRILRILQPATPGWKTRCITCSARVAGSMPALWSIVNDFMDATRTSGTLEARRRHQATEWMHAMIGEELHNEFFRNATVREILPRFEHLVASQSLPAATAVRRIMESFKQQHPCSAQPTQTPTPHTTP